MSRVARSLRLVSLVGAGFITSPEVVELLRAECDPALDSLVAETGSGTGKFTALPLPHTKCVLAIEPNFGIREAEEQSLLTHSNFASLAAAAEAATRARPSVDLIVAGQAFHWFDRERARTGSGRILISGGRIALI